MTVCGLVAMLFGKFAIYSHRALHFRFRTALTHHFVEPMPGHHASIACMLYQTNAILGRATAFDGTVGPNIIHKYLQGQTKM